MIVACVERIFENEKVRNVQEEVDIVDDTKEK
jgi:hypothetical protein